MSRAARTDRRRSIGQGDPPDARRETAAPASGEIQAFYAAPIYSQVSGYVEMSYKEVGPVRPQRRSRRRRRQGLDRRPRPPAGPGAGRRRSSPEVTGGAVAQAVDHAVGLAAGSRCEGGRGSGARGPGERGAASTRMRSKASRSSPRRSRHRDPRTRSMSAPSSPPTRPTGPSCSKSPIFTRCAFTLTSTSYAAEIASGMLAHTAFRGVIRIRRSTPS